MLVLSIIARVLDCLLDYPLLILFLSTLQYNMWATCKVVSYKVDISCDLICIFLFFPLSVRSIGLFSHVI